MKIKVQLQNEFFKSSVTLHEWVPNNSQEQHGVAASCLEQLRNKACDILAIDKSLAPVTLPGR